MALIECPDCAHKVSDQAKVCRHCGRPIKDTMSYRLEKEEIELDIFDPHEAQSMRTQIMKNERLLLQSTNQTKAALKKKKKNVERMGMIKTVALITIIGVAAYLYKRMS